MTSYLSDPETDACRQVGWERAKVKDCWWSQSIGGKTERYFESFQIAFEGLHLVIEAGNFFFHFPQFSIVQILWVDFFSCFLEITN